MAWNGERFSIWKIFFLFVSWQVKLLHLDFRKIYIKLGFLVYSPGIHSFSLIIIKSSKCFFYTFNKFYRYSLNNTKQTKCSTVKIRYCAYLFSVIFTTKVQARTFWMASSSKSWSSFILILRSGSWLLSSDIISLLRMVWSGCSDDMQTILRASEVSKVNHLRI